MEALLSGVLTAQAAVDGAYERSPEAEVEAMEALREQAADNGGHPKTDSVRGFVGCMCRKFEKFLQRLGVPYYGYVPGTEPSIDVVKRFVEWCYSGGGREYEFSIVGRKGLYDAYFEVHLAYNLARKVFPMMGLAEWVSLSKTERKQRALPFKEAIQEHFKAIKVSRQDVAGMGRSLQKEKWDDNAYFLAQDYWMERLDEAPNRACFSLAVMGFVRVTCSRGGSMGQPARIRSKRRACFRALS